MSESTDRSLLDLIRRHGPLTVDEMVEPAGGDGDGGAQSSDAAGRARGWSSGGPSRPAVGGPSILYQASVEAHKRLGQNYADLAVVLWDEMMRTVEDRKLRRVLFGRITERLAELYRAQVTGVEWEGRLVQLGTVLHDRGIETEVTCGGDGGPAAGLEAAFVPLLRARRGRSRRLRHGTKDVREGARPQPSAQPVPARRPPLVRLRGQAGRDPRPGQGRVSIARPFTPLATARPGTWIEARGPR